MKYKYNSPEEAIISLETAYTNKDLGSVLDSKDFKTEAILLLKQANYQYNINDEDLINETSELLKLALIENLQENGYPNFDNVKRVFSDLKKLEDNIYFIEEKLFFPNNIIYSNKIFLSNQDAVWKVAMIEE